MFKIDLRKVQIGSDFEMFAVDSEGKFISAIPFIDGTKDAPLAITDEGHAIQHDGALLEGNVPPVPLDSREEMWDNIQFVTKAFQERLPDPIKVKCCPNGEYENSQLEDPEARMFGCDPDFNAWEEGDINQKPDAETTNARCCGFHLHISFPGATAVNVMRLVRLLDVHVTLPLLFVDEDRTRRKLYGKAGCFRFKNYGNVAGVEYRALSNSAIKDKETFTFVWDQVKTALVEYNLGTEYTNHADVIQQAINTYDLELAEELCEEFNVLRYEETAY